MSAADNDIASNVEALRGFAHLLRMHGDGLIDAAYLEEAAQDIINDTTRVVFDRDAAEHASFCAFLQHICATVCDLDQLSDQFRVT